MNFSQILQNWPLRTLIAEGTGASYSQVTHWEQRGHVPREWWDKLVAFAIAGGLGDRVTIQALEEAEAQYQASKPPRRNGRQKQEQT